MIGLVPLLIICQMLLLLLLVLVVLVLLVVVVFLVVMVEGSGSTKQNLNYHHQPEDNIVYKQTRDNIGLYQFY